MPDEDTTTAGPAVDTDAQKPAGSEAADDSAELDLEPGTGAQAEQESQDDKPETEQEQGQEEAGGDKAISDLVAELEKEDPEFAKALAKGRGEEAEPEDPLDAREAEIVRKESALESKDTLTAELSKIDAAFNATITDAGRPLAQALETAQATVQRSVEEAGGDKGSVSLDSITAPISTYGLDRENIGYAKGARKALAIFKARVLSSAASRHFSDDERKALLDLNPIGDIGDGSKAIGLLIDTLYAASARSAPKRIRETATKEAEEKVGLTEKTKRLAEMLGSRNGKVKSSVGEGGGSSAGPRNETEARNWHAEGKWDTRQMRAYLNKLKA